MASIPARFVNDSGVTELEGTLEAEGGESGGLVTGLIQIDGGLYVAPTQADIELTAGLVIDVQGSADAAAAVVEVTDFAGNLVLQIDHDGVFFLDTTLQHDGTMAGFFGKAPVAKPTGVAVSAAGIHAALVALGLIAA